MAPAPQRHDSHWHPESEPSRLIALSDGIFSVALTIAVVEIMPPELTHQLRHEGAAKVLAEILPNMMWLAMNFLLVAVYWIAHHRIFAYVRRADYQLLFLNIYFLMLITFMPFAVKVVFASPANDPAAVAFYATFMGVTGVALNMIWNYATKGRRLVDKDLDPVVIRYAHFRTYTTVAIFFLSALVGYFYDAVMARYLWALLFLNRRIAVYLAQTKLGVRLIPAD